MTSKEIEERSAGVRAFRADDPYLAGMPKAWRNGWIAARNERLSALRNARMNATRPIGAPAPLIDVDRLKLMRMAGR